MFLKHTDQQREKIVEKIRRAESALHSAGPIHTRDLHKHIKRMRRELKQYDRYQAAARQAG